MATDHPPLEAVHEVLLHFALYLGLGEEFQVTLFATQHTGGSLSPVVEGGNIVSPFGVL